MLFNMEKARIHNASSTFSTKRSRKCPDVCMRVRKSVSSSSSPCPAVYEAVEITV